VIHRESRFSHDDDLRAIVATGALAYVEAELDRIEGHLADVPSWRPARALEAELAWVRDQVSRMEDAWGKKLVVVIAGPSGAGKSTLLNALAGRELSQTGLGRPTTRRVVVYRQHPEDGAALVRDLGPEHVVVNTVPGAEGLDGLVLVDTPDTNTLPENRQLLGRALGHADVILLVFNALNPKMRDNVAFWAPIVQQYDAEALVPILNGVDRVPWQELENDVVPDMVSALERAWDMPLDKVYLVSARTSAPNASFAEDERPLHDVNQFDALREWLFSTLGRADQASERRLARAEHLLVLLKGRCRDALQGHGARRSEIERLRNGLERDAAAAIQTATRESTGRSLRRARQTALYVQLADRAWGPVGWFVMVWALLLRLVAFLRTDKRPLGRQFALLGRVSDEDASDSRLADAVVRALDRLYARCWPPLADALVAAGFDAGVRQAQVWESGARDQAESLLRRREVATVERVGRYAMSLSSWPIQLLANAPTLGLAVWVGVYTVTSFFGGQSLGGDYFPHAGMALLVVWLASVTLYQAVVSLLLGRAMDRAINTALATDSEPPLPSALSRELETLDALAALCAE